MPTDLDDATDIMGGGAEIDQTFSDMNYVPLFERKKFIDQQNFIEEERLRIKKIFQNQWILRKKNMGVLGFVN
jgi:hypothetical protein